MAAAQTAGNRIFYMQDKKPAINSSTGPDPRELLAASAEPMIEFRDVHFRYPSRPDKEVLRGLNMTIRTGEKVCLVGASGSGKSTVISLIERFFDATSGILLLGGRSIRDADVRKLRSMMALVSQDTVLYQGTIRENLLLGVSEADEEIPEDRLKTACRQASIDEFISSLPNGYDTDCGPRGLSLSGGQRQRLAIARALLRNPDMLLLDEATSALDPKTEAVIWDALALAARGRTTISTVHGVETMKRADRIFVIDAGVVAEEGTFQALMDKRGTLWKLVMEKEVGD
jgi:ATP-binding cassette, subfamily B (MDR/TAP), member 1